MSPDQIDAGTTDGSARTPGALFRAGHLEASITAANEAVRSSPNAIANRLLLAELLLFTGRFERADTVLAAAEAIDPSVGLVASEFRHLLRGEIARRQTWQEGRVPEFIGDASPALGLSLKALTLLRENDQAGAAEAAAEAEAIRPRVPGTHEATGFDDFRDANDLCASFVEVLTVTGRYFWMPTDRLEDAVFHPPKRPRDLFWRRVSMTVRDGPDGDVYMPAIYAGIVSTSVSDQAPDTAEEALRLGQTTDWSGEALVTGRGQRLFLVGEEGLAAQDLGSLVFG
ncbi:type VI secretion system accessory protein TagJ [Lichenicola sp.]|uniref:type VI secretion system accessory protein TagJ n=1 Tax=Lichenicola sp. TaxID=2804529 RepID=UPI003B000FC5